MGERAWHFRQRERTKAKTEATWAQSVADRATPEWKSSLTRRLITAGVAIPVVLAMVWFGGWVTFGGAVLIVTLGVYELHSMFHKIGYLPLTWFSWIVAMTLLVGGTVAPLRNIIMELAITALVLGSLSWLLIRRHQTGSALVDWALTLVMALYLGWPLSYLLTLRGMNPAYQFTNHGLIATAGTTDFWWLLVVFFGVWAFDSAAYFTGRFFGNHKLAPAISPAKTWEGAIGGTIFSIAAVLVFTRPIAAGVAWYHAIALGLLISFAATIGDLSESLIKRQADVKDSGKFFWGHGGVLDRIDSLLFAAVVVYFYVILVLHGI
jgi:phosphatidate cytidylyltransferase